MASSFLVNPLEVPSRFGSIGALSEDRLSLTPKRQAELITGFLILGLVARSVRYLLCFPLWEDEAFLCANLAERSYAELLDPLTYHQVAPVLFLWTQLTLVKWLGFSELVLRLLPFACGVGSLFLFKHVAERLLRGTALVLAIAIFAVAYPGIRYSAEAKPYGVDVFVGLVLVALAVRWCLDQDSKRWLGWLTAVLPAALGFSFPAVFIAGGISLVVGCQLLVQRTRPGRWTWIGYNLVLVASFLGWYSLTAVTKTDSDLQWMQAYWRGAFPPVETPSQLPAWFLTTHTGHLLAYPVGGERGASGLTFLWCTAALVTLWHRRQVSVLLLCLAPFGLHLVAAALHRYPYGEHVKFSHYLAGLICLMSGLGAATWLNWLARSNLFAKYGWRGFLLLLATVGVSSMARDVARPYKSETTLRARAFAQWFWFDTELEGETVCLKTDLGQEFSQQTYKELGWSAVYLCNQRIYSPRHRRGHGPRWERITAEHPLRCVQFVAPSCDFDEAAFEDWMDSMLARYDLTAQTAFPFAAFDKHERDLRGRDYVRIYHFVPKPEIVAQRPDSRR